MTSLLDVKSFGETSAEDDDIRKYFLRTPVFTELWSGTRCITTGRKGSGKTALYFALQYEAADKKFPCRSLSFSDYPWAAHRAYASSESTDIERYVETWRFFLLIQTFTALIEANSNFVGATSRPFREVRKFIDDNYGHTTYDFKKVFPSGGLVLNSLTANIGLAKSVNGEAGFTRTSASLGSVLPRLNEWLGGKLKEISPSMPTTYILFDELDLGFDINDEDYMSRIAGLLMATRRFARWSMQNQIPARPIVFLRSDIFDSLHFGDLNKIREANRIDLKWHDRLDPHQGESLKALMDFRIREILDLPDSIEDPWKSAFDDRVMRGTLHKFQHITYRTFLRPRDVIKFCNLALTKAQERIRSTGIGDDIRISNDDITMARNEYSLYFFNELDDEISEAEPRWQEATNVLRKIAKDNFSRDEFAEGYRTLSESQELTLDPTAMLNLLYRFSIIGYEGTRPTGSGTTHLFRYQNESLNFDIQARSFRVHRGLKEALGLVEGSPGL